MRNLLRIVFDNAGLAADKLYEVVKGKIEKPGQKLPIPKQKATCAVAFHFETGRFNLICFAQLWRYSSVAFANSAQ